MCFLPLIDQLNEVLSLSLSEMDSFRILLYSLIFLLSVFGNLLIIVVLMLNKRMRTVTNSFLLSLAVSDLMMAVFCMPFTLIPNILEDFIFGGAMCKTVSYFMGEDELFYFKPELNATLYFKLQNFQTFCLFRLLFEDMVLINTSILYSGTVKILLIALFSQLSQQSQGPFMLKISFALIESTSEDKL